MLKALAKRAGLEVIPAWRSALYPQAEYIRKLFDLLSIDCVLDVGANVGQFRDFLRLHVGYHGRIVSFEPMPECVSALKRRASEDRAWEIRPVALSSVNGKAVLNVMRGSEFNSLHKPDASLPARFVEWNQVERTLEVETQRLDDVMPVLLPSASYSRVYLKMDTQGHDLEVMRGAADTLGLIPALQTEIAFVRVYEGAPGWEATFREVLERGFEVSGIFPNNPHHFPRMYEADCHFINRSVVTQK